MDAIQQMKEIQQRVLALRQLTQDTPEERWAVYVKGGAFYVGRDKRRGNTYDFTVYAGPLTYAETLAELDAMAL